MDWGGCVSGDYLCEDDNRLKNKIFNRNEFKEQRYDRSIIRRK